MGQIEKAAGWKPVTEVEFSRLKPLRKPDPRDVPLEFDLSPAEREIAAGAMRRVLAQRAAVEG